MAFPGYLALVVLATPCCQGQRRGSCASVVLHTTRTMGAPWAATEQASDPTWELLSCMLWEAQQPLPACS